MKKAKGQKSTASCSTCANLSLVSSGNSVQKSVPSLVQDGGPAAQRGKTDYAVFPNACWKTAWGKL